jgi:D-arabinose 1-dehydrogenase-like Zn-dependent alcohol dehydrogenase
VGHFAVQYARHLGAKVTGVCGPDNVAFVESLGTDQVVDYRATDILTGGTRARNVTLRSGAAALNRLAQMASHDALKPHIALRIGL